MSTTQTTTPITTETPNKIIHHRQMSDSQAFTSVTPSYPSANTTGIHQQVQGSRSTHRHHSAFYHQPYEVTTSSLHQQSGETRILSERLVETEIRVPRLQVTHETVEKLVVVPETIRREEVIEETQTIRERIVEVEKPLYQQKYVEVPDIEFVEKIVELPQTIYQDKIREVPRLEYQEHITYKPKIVIKEIIKEVPEVEIVEVPIEKIIEIPEIREQIIVKEKRVDRYVDCAVAECVDIEIPVDVHRKNPIPIQSVTNVEYHIPAITTKYEKVPIPIYAPRFIEVAVPIEQMDEETFISSERLLQELRSISAQQYPSLCELETIGANAKAFHPALHTNPAKVLSSWRSAVSESIHTGLPAYTNFVNSGTFSPANSFESQSSFRACSQHMYVPRAQVGQQQETQSPFSSQLSFQCSNVQE